MTKSVGNRKESSAIGFNKMLRILWTRETPEQWVVMEDFFFFFLTQDDVDEICILES